MSIEELKAEDDIIASSPSCEDCPYNEHYIKDCDFEGCPYYDLDYSYDE